MPLSTNLQLRWFLYKLFSWRFFYLEKIPRKLHIFFMLHSSFFSRFCGVYYKIMEHIYFSNCTRIVVQFAPKNWWRCITFTVFRHFCDLLIEGARLCNEGHDYMVRQNFSKFCPNYWPILIQVNHQPLSKYWKVLVNLPQCVWVHGFLCCIFLIINHVIHRPCDSGISL